MLRTAWTYIEFCLYKNHACTLILAQCIDALQLVSKGRYGSFHLGIKTAGGR